MSDSQPKQASPISLLLRSLGLTRDDLNRHSDQMRQFLTEEHANSLRAMSFAQENHDPPKRSSSFHSLASSSISRSNSAPDASPELAIATVKQEPVDQALPTRQFDSMEMVLERQSRQNRKDRKSRKMRERSHTIPQNHHHSPSPSHASSSSHGLSLDSFMHSRDVRRVSAPEPSDPESGVPSQDVGAHTSITPTRSKYYRDYDTNEPSILWSQRGAHERISPSLSRRRLTTAHTANSKLPTSPNTRSSPLPPSSPPGVSPLSSPTKIINTVSSPGPMDDLPLEEEYDDLPYTLPPGPFSSTKPELSYAALVGQAILSSPQHRLTLQEIYDWITIVYPYFKRGETTWMNSIRHVLSTTACFRKVVRDRSIGRTLWAIWDQDLPCFEGGGFKKQLCRDIEVKPRATAATRKRNAGEAGSSPKKTKRARKDKAVPPPAQQSADAVAAAQTFPFFAQPHNAPMFPHIRPTVHHQPYYDSCLPQSVPADIIFPPLPPSASYGYHHVLASSAGVTSDPETSPNLASASPEIPLIEPISPPRHSAPSYPSSIPGLTPNRSSSPSPSLPSDAIAMAAVRAAPDADKSDDCEMDDVFTAPGSLAALETLLDHAQRVEAKKITGRKGKARQAVAPLKKSLLPPMPASPSLSRKATLKSGKKVQDAALPSVVANAHVSRRSTPPSRPHTVPDAISPARISASTLLDIPYRTHNNEVPTTPPRNSRSRQHVELSPIRTPLSHRGLHMSPSASLAHYKSNLDPPPAVVFRLTPEPDTDAVDFNTDTANMRTPVRKRGANAAGFPPVTPKRLIFGGPSGGTQDSPLRTPSGRTGLGAGASSSGLAPSPFRTPGSRGIFDPHDPGALLDEELSRLGGNGQLGYENSPAGLFGRAGGLLYESPSVPSPSRWSRWW